jgi:hypothetical protein
VVEEVKDGSPNTAHGKSGQRFDPPVLLSDLDWFKDFIDQQQNFSLGVREIQEEFLAELEKIREQTPRHP